jgi:O-acetylserine/cysteine efflux transporter
MRAHAILAGIVAIVFWAALPVLVKVGLAEIGIPLLLLGRFVIGAIPALPFLSRLLRKGRQIQATDWLWLGVVLGANYYLQARAVAELPASFYIVVFALNPMLSLLVIGTRMTPRILGPIALAAIGTLGFANGDSLTGRVAWPAMLFLVGGMLSWVFYTLLLTRLQKVYDDFDATLVTQLVSLTAVSAIWLGAGAPWTPLGLPTVGLLALLGIGSFLAYLCFSFSLRHFRVFGVASQYLEPVIGLLLAWAVLGERISVQQWCSTAIIFAALIWLSRAGGHGGEAASPTERTASIGQHVADPDHDGRMDLACGPTPAVEPGHQTG